MTTQTIIVQVKGQKTRSVEATVIGPFAFHATVTESGSSETYFTITHLATGRSISEFINTPTKAKRIIKALTAATHEWNDVTEQSGEVWERVRDAAMSALLDFRKRGWL